MNRRIAYNSIKDILKEYPQRNLAWTAGEENFSAEASELEMQNHRDPWNRKFPNQEGYKKFFSEYGELEYYILTTTVNGYLVKCIVFND
jgi:murein tripeptide amidase MpaA